MSYERLLYGRNKTDNDERTCTKNGSCETGETKTALEKVPRTPPPPSTKNRTAVTRQNSGNICAVVGIGYMPAGSFL